jgi:hypothetical protein
MLKVLPPAAPMREKKEKQTRKRSSTNEELFRCSFPFLLQFRVYLGQ